MYDYKKLKKSKSVKMKKEGKDFSLIITRFDENTGEEKEPTIIMLHKHRLEADKAAHEKEVADLNEILKDMDVLEKKTRGKRK